MKIYYALTTLDSLVLSQTNATTNNHQVLDYIPGSAVLGALAGKLYDSLTDEQSWHLFHSGKVQFGPAYCEIDGEMGWPIPASWHYPKGEAVFEHNSLTQHVENQAGIDALDLDEAVQFKQCRSGYINSRGKQGSVKQGMVTKTALNRESGAVKDGSLFSYAYLAKGQRFIGWVECDSAEYYDLLEGSLVGQHRIGRSRGTEFGRVSIELLAAPDVLPVSLNERLVLWCLSDCQCVDFQGMPTFTPELCDLVLGAKGTLNQQQSFIRSNSITRFNQKRGGFDSEQLVISKGSVLVFDDVELCEDQLHQLSGQGIGLNRQQGLGWVAVNPSWAYQKGLSEQPLFAAPSFELSSLAAKSAVAASAENSPLIAWIEQQADRQNQHAMELDGAKSLLQAIILAYVSVRKYNRVIHSHQAGPSSSQWRRIAELLREGRLDWQALLFDKKNGICNASNDPLGWGITWHDGQHYVTFSEYFQGLLEQSEVQLSVSQMRRFLEQLCRYDLSVYQELKTAAKDFTLSIKVEEANA
ncbi:TPA: hypothetical protein ACGUVR_001631 [Vibrio vulnificus]